MLLRLTKDPQNNVLVESLHFLFAINYIKEVSLTFDENQRKEMLSGVKTLLIDDWPKFRYFNFFISRIEKDASFLFRENPEWFKNYFEHLQQDSLHGYSFVIKKIFILNRGLFDEIFTNDYFQRHSQFFSQLPVSRLGAIANLIYSLPDEKKYTLQPLIPSYQPKLVLLRLKI